VDAHDKSTKSRNDSSCVEFQLGLNISSDSVVVRV
jgi:hypothetical protein